MYMRTTVALVIGGSMAAAAWVVGNAAEGIVGATAFLLAPFLAAITVGVTISQFFGSPRRRPTKPDHCSACGQSMGQIGALWVCNLCDRAPIAA